MKIYRPFRTAFVATLGVGLGIALISAIGSISTILLYIGLALFLALGVEPLVQFLERCGFARWLAVLASVLLVIAVFAGIALIIIPVLFAQITQLVNQGITWSRNPTGIEGVQLWLQETFPGLDSDRILDEGQRWALTNLTSIASSLIGASVGLLNGVVGAFIVAVLTIYFVAALPSLRNAVAQLVPASSRSRFVDLSDQITDSVGHYVMGQLTMAAISGVFSLIVLTVLGAPYPAVLAVIAFLFSLIPLVGTITGSTIIVLICMLPGSEVNIIALVICYLVYLPAEGYLFGPRIMSRAVSVPTGVIVVAALIGGALLGPLGALVAIPTAASAMIIYRQVLVPKMNAK